jgi:RNA polymerase sigma-70 factor (ECF subfamily)
MRQLLDGVLDRMDESLRVVFVLYEFEEMNMSEIADVLEIPRGTVASRLRRPGRSFASASPRWRASCSREREDERKP